MATTAALFLTASACPGARIYYTDQPAGAAGSVISVALDGSSQSNVVTVQGAADLRGIGFHRASGRIYFLDNGTARKIYSILPNGTDQREILPLSLTQLNADLEIDEAAGKLYWAENNPTIIGNGFIMRANLDGTMPEPAVSTAPGTATAPYFMFLDPGAGYIYWGVVSGGSGPSSFRRATFAGEIDPDFLITTATRTRDIVIDSSTATAYWCDRQTGTIFRRSLAGGPNQTVISGMNAPHGIALDVEAGKVYWTDTGGRGNPPQGLSVRRIARCNLDGTEFENLSTPAANSEPWDLALDTSSPTFAAWRTRFFSASALLASPLDDADADGAPNLLEYALGSHPRRASSVPRLAAESTGMRYSRRVGANLLYRVEVSTDLEAWNYNGDSSGLVWTAETAVTPVGAELESVLIQAGPALVSAPKAFFRIQVSEAPAGPE